MDFKKGDKFFALGRVNVFGREFFAVEPAEVLRDYRGADDFSADYEVRLEFQDKVVGVHLNNILVKAEFVGGCFCKVGGVTFNRAHVTDFEIQPSFSETGIFELIAHFTTGRSLLLQICESNLSLKGLIAKIVDGEFDIEKEG